ncbi:MAG: hypothetical protein DWB56_05580 [Candidatus Jettenia sp.]|nr:hypothetical protein [Candidatus Jettenia sp. AMX1]MBC6928426.1 hypothetical protein [Candidatus Jettenia sp.]NUN23742.1 hypothetical protein [Candidatus Jettenia caeni]KAA0250458.1 MAG: hypothetical protein EDM77_04970 [Candidatus Jettenia sp. AMX1]MCE7879645.1 hypothetical protein [Candidatus Jettenia sp. AMX1]MCQ3926513.1 hypothetical protein [Candidatus Jettenia sp.]
MKRETQDFSSLQPANAKSCISTSVSMVKINHDTGGRVVPTCSQTLPRLHEDMVWEQATRTYKELKQSYKERIVKLHKPFIQDNLP